jgi:hypothetical protein
MLTGQQETAAGFGLQHDPAAPCTGATASRTTRRAHSRLGGCGTPAHWLLLREHGSLASCAGGLDSRRQQRTPRSARLREDDRTDTPRGARTGGDDRVLEHGKGQEGLPPLGHPLQSR